MKRLLALIVIGLIGFVAYFFLYQPYVAPIVDIYQQAGQIAALDDRVENQEHFTPPEDSVLRAADIERFVAVQQAMASGLTGQVDTLRMELEEMERHVKVQAGSVDVAGLRDAVERLIGQLIEAKEVQVGALNEQAFSLEEYAWVRREIYRAADIPLPERGLTGVIADVRRGRLSLEGLMPEEPAAVSGAPEENRVLVASYAEALGEHAGLAFLGL